MTNFTHIKKCTGKMVDSRKLIIYLPDYKREILVDLLGKFLSKNKFLLFKVVTLVGSWNLLQNYAHGVKFGFLSYILQLGKNWEAATQQ